MANWQRTPLENGALYTAEDSLCAILGEYASPLFEADCPYWVVQPRYGAKTWRVEAPSLEEAIRWAEGQL